MHCCIILMADRHVNVISSQYLRYIMLTGTILHNAIAPNEPRSLVDDTMCQCLVDLRTKKACKPLFHAMRRQNAGLALHVHAVAYISFMLMMMLPNYCLRNNARKCDPSKGFWLHNKHTLRFIN